LQTRCNASFIRSSHRARAGISLLEVMFAIGVVMIGLVGIAALLPVGGSLARKGAVADAAAKAGANAVREFRARGMSNPDNWRWFRPAGDGEFRPVPTAQGAFPSPGTSFCLDPLFIAAPTAPDRNLSLGSDKYKQEMRIRRRFPLNKVYERDTPVLAMPRITLHSPATANGVLDQLVAQELFASADDLVFDRPSDRTLGPVQNFASRDAAGDNPVKRYADCHISWMATIVPKLDRIRNAESVTGMNPTNEYTLSIVVFDRRPIDRDLYDADTDDLVLESMVSERVVMVMEGGFHSGNPAFSGGDMTLATRDSRGEEDGADGDLELRGGDWIMLSREKPLLGGRTVKIHKWYRVTNAGEDPVFDQYENGRWTRDVTVVGPDWDWHPNYPTQATIVHGVVEVLEKTVRLENNSMWTR
ncbi:MAG: type IV pilus modification PilV family protein, partial [Planctomycetota bacterium]